MATEPIKLAGMARTAAVPPRGQIRILRSETTSARPEDRLEGELYLSIPDRTIGIIGANGAPRDIVTPFFNAGGFVNKLRNPGMLIWQRGTTFAVGHYGRTADGWLTENARSTISRIAAPSGWVSPYAAQWTITSGGGFWTIEQNIEAAVAAPLAGKRCTLQFRCEYSAGGSHSSHSIIYIQSFNVADQSGALTLEHYFTWWYSDGKMPYSITFDLSNNARNGIRIYIIPHPHGPVGGTFTIGDFDLRETPGWPVGPCANPPPVEIRPLPVELAICQRYFEKSYNLDVRPGTPNYSPGGLLAYQSGFSHDHNYANQMIHYAVTKRVTPTLTIYSPTTGAVGRVRDDHAGVDVLPNIHAPNVNQVGVYASLAAPNTFINLQLHWTASAEL